MRSSGPPGDAVVAVLDGRAVSATVGGAGVAVRGGVAGAAVGVGATGVAAQATRRQTKASWAMGRSRRASDTRGPRPAAPRLRPMKECVRLTRLAVHGDHMARSLALAMVLALGPEVHLKLGFAQGFSQASLDYGLGRRRDRGAGFLNRLGQFVYGSGFRSRRRGLTRLFTLVL